MFAGQTDCPAYPTELVIGLDMSKDVDYQVFERMFVSAYDLLEDISISESNCPRGARVAVVSYNSHTKHLIRFSDYKRKGKLMELVRNITLEPRNDRNIGQAMQFVARHVFKRTRSGALMRKVAIFFANGASQDATAINTAMLELKAHNIQTAVIGLRNTPNVRRAFEVTLLSLPSMVKNLRPYSKSIHITTVFSKRIENIKCFEMNILIM